MWRIGSIQGQVQVDVIEVDWKRHALESRIHVGERIRVNQVEDQEEGHRLPVFCAVLSHE